MKTKEKEQAKEASKMLKQDRLDAVKRIQEIEAEVHLLTKEKNLLGVSISKIDAALN